MKKRQKIYEKYLLELEDYSSNLKIPKYSKDIKSSNHLFIINIMFHKFKKNKDDFMKYLNRNKILGQQHYIPIYKFKIYKEKSIKFSGSEKYYKNAVSIPIFVSLENKYQNKIIKVIKNYFKK